MATGFSTAQWTSLLLEWLRNRDVQDYASSNLYAWHKWSAMTPARPRMSTEHLLPDERERLNLSLLFYSVVPPELKTAD